MLHHRLVFKLYRERVFSAIFAKYGLTMWLSQNLTTARFQKSNLFLKRYFFVFESILRNQLKGPAWKLIRWLRHSVLVLVELELWGIFKLTYNSATPYLCILFIATRSRSAVIQGHPFWVRSVQHCMMADERVLANWTFSCCRVDFFLLWNCIGRDFFIWLGKYVLRSFWHSFKRSNLLAIWVFIKGLKTFLPNSDCRSSLVARLLLAMVLSVSRLGTAFRIIRV